MIEHQIDHHAGYRNVEPERQRPTGNPAMPEKITSRGAIDGNRNQRNYDDSKDDVTNENHEIERANNTLPLKWRVAMMIVVNKIGSQK